MRQWDDWEQKTGLSDTPLWSRIIIGLCCGLLVPWLLQTWSTGRAEAPVQYEVDRPERLRGGQGYDVDEHENARDEVCIGLSS